MIKLVFLMRRKPGMSREAFAAYWRNDHTRLILKHAATLKIRRYVQSHPVAPEAGAELRPDSHEGEPWDGISEIWLDGVHVLRESRESPDIQALQKIILADEANFVDLDRLQMIVTREHEIIAPA